MDSLLVVGGTGFLGSELIRQTEQRIARVHGTHRSRPIPDDVAGAEWHRLDITDRAAVDQLVAETGADTVINTAYQQNGPDVAAICCDGAAALASACASAGARLVHVSTDLVFDGTLGRPYAEADEANPIMAYGQAKLDGEHAVLAAMPSALVARTSIIYGSDDAPQEQLVRRAVTDPNFAFFTDEFRSPVHVEDLAAALLDLARTDARGVLHLGSDSRIDRHHFASLLAQHAGLDTSALQGRTQDPSLGPRPADVSLDSTRAVELLGRSLPHPAVRLGQASTSDSS